MDVTPVAHRVGHALNWSGAAPDGRPKDGDTKWVTINGVRMRMLLAQPRKGVYQGVSFFVPSPELSIRAHNKLGKQQHGCKVTVPGKQLPEHFKFVHDGPLMLRLDGDDDPLVESGDHWTLYTTADMPASHFEAEYVQFMTSKCDSCPMMQAGAESQDLPDLDDDFSPADRLTNATVMALDNLVLCTDDPNVKLFARLFALHLRATDMDFPDVLSFGAIANMAAVALAKWTVRDPFLEAHACAAQDLLSQTLEDDTFARPAYKPYWVSCHCGTFCVQSA